MSYSIVIQQIQIIVKMMALMIIIGSNLNLRTCDAIYKWMCVTLLQFPTGIYPAQGALCLPIFLVFLLGPILFPQFFAHHQKNNSISVKHFTTIEHLQM